jgi:hypothetical protein
LRDTFACAGTDPVERAADRGEVKRDRRERLSLELAVDDDGRSEVAPACFGEIGIGDQSIDHVLEGGRLGGLRDGRGVHYVLALVDRR